MVINNGALVQNQYAITMDLLYSIAYTTDTSVTPTLPEQISTALIKNK